MVSRTVTLRNERLRCHQGIIVARLVPELTARIIEIGKCHEFEEIKAAILDASTSGIQTDFCERAQDVIEKALKEFGLTDESLHDGAKVYDSELCDVIFHAIEGAFTFDEDEVAHRILGAIKRLPTYGYQLVDGDYAYRLFTSMSGDQYVVTSKSMFAADCVKHSIQVDEHLWYDAGYISQLDPSTGDPDEDEAVLALVPQFRWLHGKLKAFSVLENGNIGDEVTVDEQ